jgi:hypothetical protein
MAMGREYVSELRPPRDYCSSSQMVHEYGEPRFNDTDREIRIARRKTCPTATFSKTNPMLTDPGANPGIRGKKFATDNLNHGTAIVVTVSFIAFFTSASK